MQPAITCHALPFCESLLRMYRKDVANQLTGMAPGEDQMMTQTDKQPEDIEGVGDDEHSSWGDYPIDTMLIRNEHRTVEDILRRIKQGMFVMDPDFQREFIWDEGKQSKLVESVMMRIPLPVFYLAEDDQGRMVVVDGLQRLSTFQRVHEQRASASP